jgi:hypothetical protein
MENDSFEELEQRLIATQMRGAPAELRGAVLGCVHRELRAARWDRRLARAAAVLLVIGAGMNLAIGLRPEGRSNETLLAAPREESLVQLAVSVAEATDAQTARSYARHLATLTGRTLTSDEVAAIDAAVEPRNSHALLNGNEG